MVLSATTGELEIIQTALAEYNRILGDEARCFCTGYSKIGMDVCVRRMQVENVMARMKDRAQALREEPRPIALAHRPSATEALLAHRNAA